MPLRCHLTAGEAAAVKTATESKREKGLGQTGSVVHCRRARKMLQLLWETAGRSFKKKIKNRITISSHFTSG